VERLINRVGEDRCLHLSLDRFYADHPEQSYEQRCLVNSDHPDSVDVPLLVKCVKQLAAGLPAEAPRYDFTVHRRCAASELLEAREVLLVEGIFALYFQEVLDLSDLKIFVDVDDDLQFARRMMRDMAERDRSAQSVYAQYVSTVKPMYQQFISPTRQKADFIVHTFGECQYNKVLDVLAAWLSYPLVRGGLFNS
jgi:uridine kinase